MVDVNENGHSMEDEEMRKLIFAARDRREQLVEIPEWGVTVLVKTMPALERAGFINNSVKEDGHLDVEKAYSDLTIRCAYNPKTGNRIFKTTDFDALNERDGQAVERIFSVAMTLNGIGESAQKAIAKNSSAPTETQTSGSATTSSSGSTTSTP